MTRNGDSSWDKRKALKTYNVRRWGIKYFDVNNRGNVTVSPLRDKGGAVEIVSVVREAVHRGLRPPFVIRFQDLLRNRVEDINESFRHSIAEMGYQGRYQGVFPTKVNQLREVVEEILDAGEPYAFGLEAGSKAELFAALAMVSGSERLIVCNGYKDSLFIRMALAGKRLGKRVILVVEKLSELVQILATAREMGVEPDLGIRARLHSKGRGKWESSSGENAKFGLSTADLLSATEMLRREGWLHCFQLLHFHVGSQVSDIRAIRRAVTEAARIYAKLRKAGLTIQYVDAGGGLGVDYDGSRSVFDSSTNYGLKEYTDDVVYSIQQVCDSEGVPHPDIVTESGRAIVAHHSVLVVQVFGAIQKGGDLAVVPENGPEPDVVDGLREIQRNLSSLSPLEAYHDAVEQKEQAESLFMHGLLALEDKAKAETLFWEICRDIVKIRRSDDEWPEELVELETLLADQYLCNFSVFQSLLDHWAIGHLFPIMPIHRLNEPPTHEATLVDITCDSDGRISKFIDLKDVRDTLPLHELRPGEPYYLGVFMVGAYQDIMGDLHNLFGRSTEVHCFLDPTEPGGYYIEEVIPGHTVSQVLGDVQYHESELIKAMKEQVERAVKEGRLKPAEGVRLLDDYEAGMREYTYLDCNGHPAIGRAAELTSPAANGAAAKTGVASIDG
ncbi:MAG: arginine decarboxylase [Candidatus Binatota bacterium]|nr:arginine decarboxylase [Candidatus Binatota bacterium]